MNRSERDEVARTVGQMDQVTSLLVETIPPMWKALYLRLLEVGFTEQQAFVLLRTYIFASAGGKMEK